MAVSGQLSNFSLPEVLQFVEEGNKSGLLAVRSLPDATQPCQNHFIWLNQGRIVAAADLNDYCGLVRLIAHRQWIPTERLLRLIQQCPLQTPFGVYLKSQKLLTEEQLKVLFAAQIIREICALFELDDGFFRFTSNIQLPYLEMIGTSIPATEVTLPGLRHLRNWAAIKDKLPNPIAGLLRTTGSKPKARLTRQELNVWEFADGTIALTEIAQRLKLSIDTIQQIAFRLAIIGLAEEVPLIPLTSATEEEIALSSDIPNAPSAPSAEMLNQMFSFLQKRYQL